MSFGVRSATRRVLLATALAALSVPLLHPRAGWWFSQTNAGRSIPSYLTAAWKCGPGQCRFNPRKGWTCYQSKVRSITSTRSSCLQISRSLITNSCTPLSRARQMPRSPSLCSTRLCRCKQATPIRLIWASTRLTALCGSL